MPQGPALPAGWRGVLVTLARLRPTITPHRNPQGGPLVSHIMSIKTEVRDPIAIRTACRRLGLPEPIQGTAKLFAGEATGLLLRLPEWLYPAVLDTATGQVRFDNYEGRWGDPKLLDRFLQIYAVEKAGLEARKKGYSVSEQSLEDGSIRLQIVESR